MIYSHSYRYREGKAGYGEPLYMRFCHSRTSSYLVGWVILDKKNIKKNIVIKCWNHRKGHQSKIWKYMIQFQRTQSSLKRTNKQKTLKHESDFIPSNMDLNHAIILQCMWVLHFPSGCVWFIFPEFSSWTSYLHWESYEWVWCPAMEWHYIQCIFLLNQSSLHRFSGSTEAVTRTKQLLRMNRKSGGHLHTPSHIPKTADK